MYEQYYELGVHEIWVVSAQRVYFSSRIIGIQKHSEKLDKDRYCSQFIVNYLEHIEC